MSDDQDMRLIDVEGGVEVGQGYVLTWSIGPGGDAWPVLADERQTKPSNVAHHAKHFRDLAPHELSGRMPDEFQQFRCAGTTSAGRPCRTVVAALGQRCHHHPEPITTPETPTYTASTAGRRRDDHPTLFDLDDRGDLL